jgi:phage tail-like protein
MPMKEAVEWALSVSYQVSLDDAELGEFSTCEGLGIEVVMEVREEGGNNDFAWSLPSRLKYPNVKLTRPLSSDSARVVRWISEIVESTRRTNGKIVAKTSAGKPILTWALADVVPVRWSGPSFSPESSKVAIETLELAHHGFRVT